MRLSFSRSAALDAILQALLCWLVASLVHGADQHVPRHSQSGVPEAMWIGE